MVKYQRYHPWRKGDVHGVDEDEDSTNHLGFVCGNSGYNRRTSSKLFYFLFLSFLSCTLILASQFLTAGSTLSLLYSFGIDDERLVSEADANASVCSSVPNGTICCDRSSIRSDLCIMKGDVRTDSASSSIFLYKSHGFSENASGQSVDDQDNEIIQHEKIRPYTRKWEASVMNLVGELDLIVKKGNSATDQHQCDVQHHVPAVFFSTGGYTGNAYHEINDGILPLYITSQHFRKKVVFVILNYHNWWLTKYADVISQLSAFPVINFSEEKRIHCFPEAIVGLRIHDELTVDPSLMQGNKTIVDFRNLLNQAYWPRIRGLIQEEDREAQSEINKLALSPSARGSMKTIKGMHGVEKPQLAIVSRNGSREITNENMLVRMAKEIGFSVKILRPDRTTELAKMYRVLNSSDLMVGVHGAAMTYSLFMRPSSVFIQIIPLGTDWAAENYYGEPAKKLGLKYIGYKILPSESSLYNNYDKNDPVLTDPDRVTKNRWEFTKKIYLDNQKVRLNLPRFRKRLLRAYYFSISMKNAQSHPQWQ